MAQAVKWKAYDKPTNFKGEAWDPSEGFLDHLEGQEPKRKSKKKPGTPAAGGDPGAPVKSENNSGKQAVQHKLARTTAPIPFQKVDWPTRTQYLKRLTQLRIEKTTWTPHWMDLSWFILPRQSRFTSSDRNQGYRKDRYIINSAATYAVKRAAAGMMSGISSPSRPWFNLTLRDQDMSKWGPAKQWLGVASDRIRSSMGDPESNFYKAVHQIYKHLLTFGTSLGFIEEDVRAPFRMYCLPIGSYSLAQSGACRVDTVYREMSLTIGQLVERFGLENCSNWVQWMWGKGNYDFWTFIVHVTEPNRAVDNLRWEAKFGPIRSAWFEMGAYSGSYGFDTSDSGYSGEPINFLLESGYKEQPFCAVRWETTGMEDVYGEATSMDCLGDIRGLQKYESAKMQMVEKIIRPPMKGPASLRSGRASILPGDFTASDESSATAKFEPAMVVPPEAVKEAREDIREIVDRINKHFLMDVWVMFLNNADDPKKTATEIQALREEKLQQLGPVLENIHGELHGPAISRIFNMLLRQGAIPPPPREIQGTHLDVEYVSMAAQAQKAIGIQSLQTTVAFAQSLAEAGRQDALDNLNVDGMMEEVGDLVNLNPSLLLTADQVKAIRTQRQQQQAQQQQAALAEQHSKTAKNLANAPTDGGNALSNMLEGMGQGVPRAA